MFQFVDVIVACALCNTLKCQEQLKWTGNSAATKSFIFASWLISIYYSWLILPMDPWESIKFCWSTGGSDVPSPTWGYPLKRHPGQSCESMPVTACSGLAVVCAVRPRVVKMHSLAPPWGYRYIKWAESDSSWPTVKFMAQFCYMFDSCVTFAWTVEHLINSMTASALALQGFQCWILC